MTKLDKKRIKELIASGATYDEAYHIVTNGIRLERRTMKQRRRGKRERKL